VDLLRETLRNLLRKPLQSFLAVLGILFGIAGELIISFMGTGIHQSIDQQVMNIGPGMMNVVSNTAIHSSPVPLQENDATALETSLQGQAIVSPIDETQTAIGGEKGTITAYVVGTNTNFWAIEPITIDKGMVFTPMDNRIGNHVCIIGNTLSQQLFNGHPINQEIVLGNSVDRVIGVFSFANSAALNGPNDLVILPIKSYMLQMGSNENIDSILLKANNPYQVTNIKNEIFTTLVRDNGWGVPTSSFQVNTQNGILTSSQSLNGLFSMFVQGVTIVAFLVGGIGIMNVMLMVVNDRKKEIGLHLAFGAKPINIFAQLLFEAVMISLIGTMGGVLFGTLTGFIMLVNGIPQAFTPVNFVQALTLGPVLGVLFGSYPSLFAAKIIPIRAIKE
jgi:putative ABC transport system permease protein